MLERDVLRFLMAPAGFYLVACWYLCYRLNRARALTRWQWLVLGIALLFGLGVVVTIAGFYFVALHPMDPPWT